MEDDPCCPSCTGTDHEREFRTAPGIRSPQTNFKDHTVRDLAQTYGLSDVNNRYGEPAKRRPQNNPATFASEPTQVSNLLGKIPEGSRDAFSSMQGGFRHPNQLRRVKS